MSVKARSGRGLILAALRGAAMFDQNSLRRPAAAALRPSVTGLRDPHGIPGVGAG